MNLCLFTMNLFSYIKIIATTLVLFAALATGWSQGVVYINRNVYVSQPELFSQSGAQTATVTLSPKRGTISYNGAEVIYTSNGTVGLDTFRVNYYVNSGGVKYNYYASYALKVDKVFLEINSDYAFTAKNQAITVEVIANDIAKLAGNGNAALSLKSIPIYTGGVSADVIGGDKIKFKPFTDFVGLAYVNYVACDDFDNCKSGLLTIQVNDPQQAASTSAQISTSKATPIPVITPRDGFSVSANPANGTVALIQNNGFRYTPNATFVGQDQITFVNAALGLTHTVNVMVLNKVTENKYAVNDLVYTAEKTSVSFDVVKNDRAINPTVPGFNESLSTKGTLTQDSNGKFTFTPNAGFNGIASFTYNLKNQTGTPTPNPIDEWATVNIVVSNHYPGKQI